MIDLAQSLEARGHSLDVECGQDFSEVVLDVVKRHRNSESEFSSVAVYTHSDFCTEEIKSTHRAERALEVAGISFKTFWGALTVHHIDDLGFDIKHMPEYKGEFNRAAKKRPIRPVLPMPQSFKPSPVSKSASSTSCFTVIDDIFLKHTKMVSEHGHNDFYSQLEQGHDPMTNTDFIKEKSSYGVSYRDGSFVWQGGESHARAYLDKFFAKAEPEEGIYTLLHVSFMPFAFILIVAPQ